MAYKRREDKRRNDRLRHARQRQTRTGRATIATTLPWDDRDTVIAAAEAAGQTVSAWLLEAAWRRLAEDAARDEHDHDWSPVVGGFRFCRADWCDAFTEAAPVLRSVQ